MSITKTADQIRVLITNTNRHIVCYFYQENLEKDHYVVIDPMLVCYHQVYEQNSRHGNVEATFIKFCGISEDNLFLIRKDWIVSITNPTKDVRETYQNNVTKPSIEIQNASNSSSPE